MGLNKTFNNYKAYSYLSENDFKRFHLFDPASKQWSYIVPLNDEEEERVSRVAAETVFISLHEHPTLLPENLNDVFDYTEEGRDHCDYGSLSQSLYDAVFDNMLDGTCTIYSKSGWKWDEILHDLGMRLCDIAHQKTLIKCERVEDIYRAFREGKIAWIASIEGSALIENEIDRIDLLYGFGVRNMGITYSESNALGSGIKEEKDGGLTAFGKKAVRRMNQVGMTIDCSHTGYKTTRDVIEESEYPIFLSHVGARALWDSKRLFPDDTLKACADRGGVIGVEAAPHTTLTKEHPRHNIDSYMDHFKYIVDLVGIEHVAFGADTLYGDHVGLHNVYSAHLSQKQTGASSDFPRVTHVEGVENPTEASHNSVRWLVKENYSDDNIAMVLGENILRIVKQVWK